MAANTIANVTETAILKLIFQNIAWANYADVAVTANQTNIGISLQTADPGEAGDASTSEIAYTAYTRVNVPRGTSTPGWLETTGTITPTANIDFPPGVGGSGTASFFTTGKSNATPPTGAQAILWSGSVSPPIVTGNGVTPRLTTASTIALD
jgi:hypothetical protein